MNGTILEEVVRSSMLLHLIKCQIVYLQLKKCGTVYTNTSCTTSYASKGTKLFSFYKIILFLIFSL